jgi:lipoate-protein ligase A
VVIGKNQNPWKEVNLAELHDRSVQLARRVSGGGTVYHDEGNLNFAFISNRRDFDQERNFEIIIDMLKDFSINADVVNVSDIVANGYKVSGNSFCVRKNKVLHHGTLLVNVNLDNLNAILTPNELNISDHAVQSRRSKVRNLMDLNADISIDLLIESLTDHFIDDDDGTVVVQDSYFNEPIEEYIKKQKDISWIYERTPDFEMEVGCNFIDNQQHRTNARINLKVSHAHITEVKNISDISKSLKETLDDTLIDRPIFSESIEDLKALITQELVNNFSNKSIIKEG